MKENDLKKLINDLEALRSQYYRLKFPTDGVSPVSGFSYAISGFMGPVDDVCMGIQACTKWAKMVLYDDMSFCYDTEIYEDTGTDRGPEDLRDDWPHAIPMPGGAWLTKHLSRPVKALAAQFSVRRIIMYLGDCKKCGCKVWWDDENSCCVFECGENCTCECPYPKEFMEEWASNSSGGYNIGTLYYFWSRGAAWQAEVMLEGLVAEFAVCNAEHLSDLRENR